MILTIFELNVVIYIFADKKSFQPKAYLRQLLLKSSLSELMDREMDMTSSIRSLDSSMQTLVYENYNKFIGATDTIKKVFCFVKLKLAS